MMSALKLNKGEEKRLRAGHLWIFSNEIDTRATPLKDVEAGQEVDVLSSRGDFLGRAYANPHSLIAARLFTRRKHQAFDTALIRERLAASLALRALYYDEPFYRLVHSEGDMLPGLIIDRYDDVCVAQFNTAGMDTRQAQVLEALSEVVGPGCLALRNDSAVRALEGLPLTQSVAFGDMPDTVCLRENGIAFETALSTGQKTGWFYDHRENRRWLQQLSADKRVLDVFSYAGAWSLNALIGNAASVTAIDASAAALASAEHNARLNGVDGRFRSLQGDAADVLRALADASEQFDIVVLDPPAFIKRKKDQRAGLRQYEQINQLACRLLSPHGILISASCSQHLQANALKTAMLRGARKQGRELQILQQGGQGPDHPVNAAMPETAYLKAFCARLL